MEISMSNTRQGSVKKTFVHLSLIAALGGMSVLAPVQAATNQEQSETATPNGNGGTAPPDTAPGGKDSGMNPPHAGSTVPAKSSKHAHKRSHAKSDAGNTSDTQAGGASSADVPSSPDHMNPAN
jgi:hypothetical protein